MIFTIIRLNPSLLFIYFLQIINCTQQDKSPQKETTSAPTAFTVETLTATSISFKWDNNAKDPLHHTVEMCSGVDCDSFSEVSTSPHNLNVSHHIETGLNPKTTYRFRIKSLSLLGYSSYLVSNNISTLLSPNESLSIKGTTSNSISLSWNVNETSAKNIEVQRCIGIDCTQFSNSFASPLSGTATEHTESELSENTTYRLRLRVISDSGNSDWLTSSNISTLPQAPISLISSSTSSSSINLKWIDKSLSETGYEVQKCVGSGCTNFVAISASPLKDNITNYTELNLSGGVYRFRIRAISSKANSDWLTSDDISTLPPTPTNITVTSLLDTSLTLSWVDNCTDELFYEVQRCVGLGCTNFTAALNSPLPANSVGYTSTGLTPNTYYSYRIRAVSALGAGDWGTLVDCLTAPTAPTGFTNGTVSGTSIQFSWTDNATTETGYEVQSCVGVSCTNYTTLTTLASNVTTYTATGLNGSTVYKFRVRAIRGTDGSDWLNSNAITTSAVAASPASCSTPKTRVIDVGTKSNVTAVGRGLWSDTKIIPGTQNPATAYYDGSATGGTASVKLSYWDGNQFNIENVAADRIVGVGSASWVKLGFLSSGRPIIVWTTGSTNVKAAMRSAALGSTGTWTTAIIDNVAGNATRTASLSISPNDDVAVAYFTNTTTAGRVRFVYCSACSNLSNFVTMTSGTDNIDNTGPVAGLLGIGTAWCNNGGSYNPAIVYHGNTAATVRYAVCTGTIASCRTSAGWTTTSVVAGAAPVLMDMQIDPTVNQSTVKILLKPAAATALTPYLSTAGCHAPASFTAGTVVGATSSGTSWAKLLKDYSGLWHVIANDSTTSVVYMNSNTTNFQTTTWNAAGTIETVTLPASGSGAGGADIANSSGMIFSSYGLAASPFNLNMGVVNDFSYVSNNASAVYYTTLPDTSGAINMPLSAGNQVRNVSISALTDGTPGVAYVDFSAGALTGGRLKYAQRNGVTADSLWIPYIIPNTINPMFPSLAYDHNGLPWISYYDSGNFRYYLVTNSAKDGSGIWSQYLVPIGNKTATATAPATDDTAIAMAYSGGIATPVVILLNGTAAGGTGVRAVRFNTVTRQFSTVVTVDATPSYATRLSADFDTNGNILIGYYDLATTTLKVNFSMNGGTTWKVTSAQLTSTGVGREGISVKFNPINSRPAVSYYNRSANQVYYSYCTTDLTSCGTAGNWTQVLAQSTSAVGVSGVSVTTNEQVLNTSLTFGSNGIPYITYMTGVSPSGLTSNGGPGLVVTDSSTGFTPTLPIPLATSYSITSALAPAALSFGQNGMNVSSIRNVLGHLISAHVGVNNWLYATSCGD